MLSKKSKAQLEQVKKYILDNHVTSFQTRTALDRLIERIKFPRVRKLEEMYGTINRTYYKNQQYDPIRNELVDSGFLSMKRVGNRCEFTVIGGKEREAFNKFMGFPVEAFTNLANIVSRLPMLPTKDTSMQFAEPAKPNGGDSPDYDYLLQKVASLRCSNTALQKENERLQAAAADPSVLPFVLAITGVSILAITAIIVIGLMASHN